MEQTSFTVDTFKSLTAHTDVAVGLSWIQSFPYIQGVLAHSSISEKCLNVYFTIFRLFLKYHHVYGFTVNIIPNKQINLIIFICL